MIIMKPKVLSAQKTLRQFDKPNILEFDDQQSRMSRSRSFRQTLLNSVFERSLVSESSAAQISSDQEEASPYGHLGFHQCMSFSPQERTIDWKYLASEVLCPSIYFSKALKKLQQKKQENLKQKQFLLPITHFECTKRRGNSVSKFATHQPRQTLAFKSLHTKRHKKTLIKKSNMNLGRRGATILAPLSQTLQRSSLTNIKHNRKILELETDIEDMQDEHYHAVQQFKLIQKNAEKLLTRPSTANSARVTERSRANSQGRITMNPPSMNVSTVSAPKPLSKTRKQSRSQPGDSFFFEMSRVKSNSVKSASRFRGKQQQDSKHKLEQQGGGGLDEIHKMVEPEALTRNNWRIKKKLPKLQSTKYDKLLKYHADTTKELKKHKSSKILALINAHQKGLIYKMMAQIPKSYVISKKNYRKQGCYKGTSSQFWLSNYISSIGKSQANLLL